MSSDLKFDKMTVDTSEALQYLKHTKMLQDASNNETYYANSVRSSEPFNLETHKNNLSDKHLETICKKLKTLSQNIEKNKLLIAQLEYVLRNVKTEETMNIDLKLIVQNIQYVSSLCKKKCYPSNVIVMHEKSPLATLGIVAQMFCAHQDIVIESTPATAVLCHLFTNICHKVGLDNVRLAFVESSLPGANDVTQIKELQSCCVGVVTERSDVDSAVDVFLASTTKYPWKIRRILVQESVAERLKNVLAWKSKLNPSNKNLDELKLKCSNIYDINDKIYLYEYSGDGSVDDYVTIEAYRTVKELLSLLNTYKPLSVSLWCSDVSESNEIAYGIDSTIVWINDNCTFDGPPKSSQAFYSIIDVSFSKIGISPRAEFCVDKLITARNNWIKLSDDEKLDIMKVVLKETQKHTILFPDDLLDTDIGDGNFVEVVKGRVCVGLEVAVGEVMFHDRQYDVKDALASIRRGNAVIYLWNDLIKTQMYAPLINAGAPMDYILSESNGEWRVPSQYSMYKIKVVRTNFGTIFAN